ncbi:MAG: glycosyltransferase family 39 protein [Bryobacteraceae bacterium]
MSHPKTQGLRDSVLSYSVIIAAALTIITEALSLFNLLTPAAVAICWAAIALYAAFRLRPVQLPQIPKIAWPEWLLLSPLLILVLLLGWISWISPPNVYDAMAYHLPRVAFWAQHGNVGLFAASYLNQLQAPPFAEYFTLHTWLLSGGDRFANFAQWGGYAGSLLAVSTLARDFGATPRGQLYAALFAASTPNAILQATGAKNDCVLTFWVLCACIFTGATIKTGRGAWLADAAIALATLTKGTAYLLLPPLIAALCLPDIRTKWRRVAALAGVGAVAILALNGPFYWRNIQLSGSPLGFDSAHGDGLYRVRNDKYGLGVTFSNAVRGLAGHIAFRDPDANQRVYNTILAWHGALGIDPADPATTWRGGAFAPTVNTNHESNSPNRWQLVILILAITYSLWQAPVRWFALGWIAAWLVFFSFLRWQPYMTRLHLPLFLTGAVFVGICLDSVRPRLLAAIVFLALLNKARPYIFDNWLRPLEGPTSILNTTREDNYFRDIASVMNPADTREIVRQIAQTDCLDIGIDTNRMELEYPFIALLLRRNPKYLFRHLDVRNASQRYDSQNKWPPCAAICLNCAAEREQILTKHAAIGPPRTLGSHLLFVH